LKQLILLLTIYLISCNHSDDSITVNKPQAIVSSKKDSVIKSKKNIETQTENTTQKINEKKKDLGINQQNPESFELVGESYGDKNWDGKPIHQQLILTQKALKEFPDTLNNIAISLYKSHEHLFPRAIADNFEKGISKEIIYYPEKLIFDFELFENTNSKKFYSTKAITVKRDFNGTLTTE
jgi:hypothetical protein